MEGGLTEDDISHLLPISDYVPTELMQKAQAQGFKGVRLGTGNVPDFSGQGHLKGVQPRGWPKGSSWDTIRGKYSPIKKWAYWGSRWSSSMDWNLLHEFGHGVGANWKTTYEGKTFTLNVHPELSALHKEYYDRLPGYFQQGGPGGVAGMSETFAEGVEHVLRGGSWVTKFPALTNWIKMSLGL